MGSGMLSEMACFAGGCCRPGQVHVQGAGWRLSAEGLGGRIAKGPQVGHPGARRTLPDQIPRWTLYFAPFENRQVPAPWRGVFIWYSQLM